MKNKELLRSAAFSLFLIVFAAMATAAQTTEFTYQGRLNVGGNPASGDYEVQFTLFSVATGGTPIGTRTRVTEAINGVFMVRLDFAPSAFNGTDRWVEVAVKPAGSPDPFVTLLPRQPVTHVPYAFQSINAAQAATATNSQQLGGLAADQFVTTDIGNSSYIQNRTTLQPGTIDFHISGNGTANIFNAGTEYRIATERVLGVAGTNNLFAGVNAGIANTTGEDNAFFGRGAGFGNTQGSRNSFFGRAAGQSNLTGNGNAFFGFEAGRSSTTSDNSFFGISAGFNNTSGASNTFLGRQAGIVNTTGSNNTAIGERSGVGLNNLSYATAIGSDAVVSASNTIQLGRTAGTDAVLIPGNLTTSGTLNLTGNATLANLTVNGTLTANLPSNDGSYIQNRTIGQQTAASFNITGNGNVGGTFHATGAINTVTQYNLGGSRILSIAGTDNLFVGLDAGTTNTIGLENVFVGRRAGNANVAGIRNAFVGFEAGKNNTSGSANTFFGAFAGQSNLSQSSNTFVGSFAGPSNTFGSENTFLGASAGDASTTGSANVFVGYRAGTANTTGDSNIMVGTFAGSSNTTGGNNIVIGAAANVGSGNLSYATAIGANSLVSSSNTISMGRADGSDRLLVRGILDLQTLVAGASVQLCRNASNQVGDCGSSFRYKTNVGAYSSGLSIIRRLRPITFNWKDGGAADVGFAAEEVAEIEPLLATYNKDGQIQGVKYAQITTVLVNAVREQQEMIDSQEKRLRGLQKEVDEQKKMIERLTNLLCTTNQSATVCRQGDASKP
jgi:hypothetical protein